MKPWHKMLLIFGAVAIGLTFIVVSAEQRRARLTAEAAAVVTTVAFDERDEEESSDDVTKVGYRFAADGRSVEGSTDVTGNKVDAYRTGQQVAICYNPKDVRETQLVESGPASCGE